MSGNDFQFLSLEDVLVLHEMQIEKYGGSRGIRDEGLLESAIGTPQASFGGQYVHVTLYEMAAAYAFHIAEKHLDKAGLANLFIQRSRPTQGD